MSRVAILPYGSKPKRLADVPLTQLNWPLGTPPDLLGCVGDLGSGDHLILYPSTWIYGPRAWGISAKRSVMIVEPEAIHKKHMVALRYLHRSFHRIFTCNPQLLESIPNGQFLAFGGTWVADWETLDCTKSRMCSLIASAKRKQTGHRLRHALIDALAKNGPKLDLMGRGYNPFEKKAEGLAPYRYSVIIENVREPGYFTEKLIDCLLCEAVPIYWGAPDIGSFLDADGMILCASLGDLQRALSEMSEADYAARRTVIEANKRAATAYLNHEKVAALAVLDAQPAGR